MRLTFTTLLRVAAVVLLLAFLFFPRAFAPLFAPLTQYGAPPIYDQGNLLQLALAQLATVCCAAAASTLVAVGARRARHPTRAARSSCPCRARS